MGRGKAKQSRSEQAVTNGMSRSWRRERAEALTAPERTRVKCTKEHPCLRWISDTTVATTTDGTLSITDDPLVIFDALTEDRVDEDGKPEVNAALLAHADNAPHGRRVDLEDVARAFAWMCDNTFDLACITRSHVVHKKSARALGRELGIDDHTAGRIQRHGLHMLNEAIADGKVGRIA